MDASTVNSAGNEEVPALTLGQALDEVAALVHRHVVLSTAAETAVALWVPQTYFIAQTDVTPYLYIHSPEMRSGKTTLMDLLAMVVLNPCDTVNPTSAPVFRSLGSGSMTLLIDEIDGVFNSHVGNDELRMILNAGHTRGKVVRRTNPNKGYQVETFPVFCPKAFAGLSGGIPGTLADRSIPIPMKRCLASERVDKLRRKVVEPQAARLRQEFARLAETIELPPVVDMPVGLSHRAADGWEILLAIADTAGGTWPARARRAAEKLHAVPLPEQESIGTELLRDCRAIMAPDGVATPKLISTDDLLRQLKGMPERRWADLDGKPLTPRRLAELLDRFDIQPKGVRIGDRTPRGYEVADFEDSWQRYL